MSLTGSSLLSTVGRDVHEGTAMQRLKTVGLEAEWSTARQSFWHAN